MKYVGGNIQNTTSNVIPMKLNVAVNANAQQV